MSGRNVLVRLMLRCTWIMAEHLNPFAPFRKFHEHDFVVPSLAYADFIDPDNLVVSPLDLAQGSWGSTNTTRTDRKSLFVGETASLLTVTSGASGSWHSAGGIGNTGSTTETMAVIVEKADSSTFAISMYSSAGGGYLGGAVALFNLDTEVAVSGPGVLERIGDGPNGGKLFRVSISAVPGAAGGARRVYLYPDVAGSSTTTGEGHIVHHVLYKAA